MILRATIETKTGTGYGNIQTRSNIDIYETHVALTFPDAKGLRLVLSLEELEKLKEMIVERRAINQFGGG